MELAGLGFRFALAGVFVLSAASKLPHRRDFTRLVRRYGILPASFVAPVAAILPPLELACAVFLGLGLATRAVAAVLCVVLLAFTVAVVVNLLRGNEIDCGCFSLAGPARISWSTVARNMALAGIAAAVVYGPPRALSVDQALLGGEASTVSQADAVAIVVVALVSVALAGLLIESRRVWRGVRAFGVGAG